MHDPFEGQRMHKRARASTTETDVTATTSTRGRSRTTATTAAITTETDTSFRPGAAASGTATRTVANGPPTHRGISSVGESFYSSYSFATQGSGLSLAVPATTPASDAGLGVTSSSTAIAAGSAGTEGMQLSQTALYGIIAGGSAGGVALLCLIGWCCWKRKKTKKDEAGWWSLDDDPSKGAVKNVGNNGGQGAIARAMSEGGGGGVDPWQSTDSFGQGPYSANEKRQQDWAQFDEKQGGRQHPQSQMAPSLSYGDLQSQRNELFGAAPPSNSRNLTPSPSHATFQSQQPPRAPFAQSSRPETGNYSVNDVISFSGGPRQNAQHRPVSSVYPSSTAEYPRSAAATPPPSSSLSSQLVPHPSTPPIHEAYNGVQVGPQPITVSSYPPKRPPRPSEVPSAPPSPYNYVKKAERPTSRDEGIADRFMDVMTGKVGKEDEKEEIIDADAEVDSRKKKRQSLKPSAGKNKKDTIMGLTDVYAGGGEEEWAQVELDPAARKSTLQRGASKRSQRTIDSPTKPGFPPLPSISSSFPQPPADASNLNSSRIDSKPLKELESYFGSFAPASRNPRALSGVSETTNGEADYSYGARESMASSNAPRPDFSRQQSFGTPGGVPASDSQNSLSPFAAPQPGRPGAYGEYNHPHSIYSAQGEVSDMTSTSGSSAGSPAKTRFGGGGLGVSTSSGSLGSLVGSSNKARSPLGGEQGDVFGSAASSHPLAPSSSSSSTSNKPALTLASDASYSLSTAELDVLNQLGLATPSSSGERTPDLSFDEDHRSNGSLSSSGGLVTPSTPHFPSPPPNLNVKLPVETSPLALKSSSALTVPSPVDLSSNGFVPLSQMSKETDPQYRSATLSMYNLYD